MTATPIFDDLWAPRAAPAAPPVRADRSSPHPRPSPYPRPSPTPRPRPVRDTPPETLAFDDTAFGRGCPAPVLDGPVATVGLDDEAERVVEAARAEVVVLGHGRMGTEHLLLALVRVGGELGRALGLRGATVAAVAAACDDLPPAGELVGRGGAPGSSTTADAALHWARRHAAAHGRAAATVTDLALGVLRAGRASTLLVMLGVDLEDLADLLDVTEHQPVTWPGRVPTTPAVAPVAVIAPGRVWRAPAGDDVPDPDATTEVIPLGVPA